MRELYLGLISGTSIDSIDAALVDFAGGGPTVVATRGAPWSPALRERINTAARGGFLTATRFAELDADVGQAFAEAATGLLQASGTSVAAVSAIGSHGQTLAHSPDGASANSLQIGDPNRIAELSGITTVADFRRRDMAAGGQGAPLAPAFHAAALRTAHEDRLVLNLGGIANLTLLPADREAPVSGFDTGPANCLLDHWCRTHTGRPYDADGAWAASGAIDHELLARLLDDDYFGQTPPKSTGTQYFSPAWLQARLDAQPGQRAPADVQATLLELTSETIRRAIDAFAPAARRLLVCGGGAHNTQLLQALAGSGYEVESTAAYGIGPDWVEAAAFAWLARETLAGRAGNLPSVTGAAGPRVLGAVYPA